MYHQYIAVLTLCVMCAINGFTVNRINPISAVSSIRSDIYSLKSRSSFESKFQSFDKSKITRETEDKQYFESEFDKQPIKER